MLGRTVLALAAPALFASGTVLACAPAVSAASQAPTPREFVAHGGVIKICTRGTLFDGLVSLGCRAPQRLDATTTWSDLRQEEDAVAPMLCKPSVVNRGVELTEVAALGAGAALQCTPVPPAWYG